MLQRVVVVLGLEVSEALEALRAPQRAAQRHAPVLAQRVHRNRGEAVRPRRQLRLAGELPRARGAAVGVKSNLDGHFPAVRAEVRVVGYFLVPALVEVAQLEQAATAIAAGPSSSPQVVRRQREAADAVARDTLAAAVEAPPESGESF